MTSAPTFTLDAHEWPGRDDLIDMLHQPNSKEEVQQFLTQEFDTLVSFKIGDLDLLAGYPEAFFLPLHAFVRSVSAGLKAFNRDGKATMPIYLQQYQVSEGDPAHTMSWRLEGDQVFVELTWGGTVQAPAHLDEVASRSVSLPIFRKEIARFVDFYTRKVALLLGPFGDWSGDDIAALFASF